MNTLIDTPEVSARGCPEQIPEQTTEQAPTSAWRATGHEAPVFADPSGRRALTMGGVGLAVAAATLAALVIVVTAVLGFTDVRSLHLPQAQVFRSSAPLVAVHRIERREVADHHRFVAATRIRSDHGDAAADRRSHA